jgi:hypothetical protein
MGEDKPAFAHSHSTSGPSDLKQLQPNDVFSLDADVTGIKVDVEWFCPHSGLADLDVYVLLYDENVCQLFTEILSYTLEYVCVVLYATLLTLVCCIADILDPTRLSLSPHTTSHM